MPRRLQRDGEKADEIGEHEGKDRPAEQQADRAPERGLPPVVDCVVEQPHRDDNAYGNYRARDRVAHAGEPHRRPHQFRGCEAATVDQHQRQSHSQQCGGTGEGTIAGNKLSGNADIQLISSAVPGLGVEFGLAPISTTSSFCGAVMLR